MDVDGTALRAAVALAAVGLLAHATYLVLQFVLWVAPSGGPVTVALLAGQFGTVAVIPAAPVAGFALAFPAERDAGPVVAGFAAGAATYGVGVPALAMAVLPGVQFAIGAPRLAVWLALLFGGAAALGAVAGDVVGPLFRAPEGEGGHHPRW